MYEVELKFRADHGPLRDRLAELDADHRESVTQADTYYDAPHREFAETDEALRVRRETRDGETTCMLTYKGPLVEAESKTREEFETVVDDGEAAAAIVESLGFEPAAVVRKDRDRFGLAGFTVTLDDVEDLGTFLEVETDVETESAVPPAREDALDLVERLGVDPESGIRASYLGMVVDAQQ